MIDLTRLLQPLCGVLFFGSAWLGGMLYALGLHQMGQGLLYATVPPLVVGTVTGALNCHRGDA